MEAADTTLHPEAGGSQTPRTTRSRRNSNLTASELTDDEDELSDHGNWLANEVEPGVDVSKTDLSDIWDKELSITVADWTAARAKVHTNLNNAEFLRILRANRPQWSKARWISFNDGLDWAVFKELVQKFGLHPLAVEDALHFYDKAARSKSDWYSNQLFIRLIFWKLAYPEEEENRSSDSDESDYEDTRHHRGPSSTQPVTESDHHKMHKAFQRRLDLQKKQQALQGGAADRPHASNGPSISRAKSRDNTLPFGVSRKTGRASIHRPIRKPYHRGESKRNKTTNKPSLLARLRRSLFGSQDKQHSRVNTSNLGVEEARTGATSRDVSENPFTDESTQHDFEREFKDAVASEEDEHNPGATHYAVRRVVKRLTQAYRLAVERQQLSIFITTDGTIISIFSRDGSEIIPSIIARLRSKDTLLRRSEDPSMLLQALLDVTVDKSLEITDAFKRKLDDLEGTALLNPSVETVRHLHVLSQQLVQIRRGMTPLQNLLLSLRSFDEERASFAAGGGSSFTGRSTYSRGQGSQRSALQATSDSQDLGKDATAAASMSSNGFVSPMARIYMSDVLDHVESAVSSLELFINMSQQLEEFIFNTLSFSSNETMKILTYITIIFLPLSFLTGYFGMNFEGFPEIIGSVSYFWKIAVPISVTIIFVLASPDLLRLGKTIQRKIMHGRLIKQHAKREKKRNQRRQRVA